MADDAFRRAPGRRRWNRLRQERAVERRQRAVQLYAELLKTRRVRGIKVEIARRLGVHGSTITRALRRTCAEASLPSR